LYIVVSPVTVLFIKSPFSFVFISIQINVNSFTVLFAWYHFAFVSFSWGEYVKPVTVECVLAPVAAVDISVLVVIDAFAVALVVLKLSFVFAVVEVALGG
jgi:hypothetical protein